MQSCLQNIQPFVTYLIYVSQHSDITHLTATKLFSRNREGIFQQNTSHGTRAHTSKATIAWLDTNIKHYIPPEDWPPNSLDLTPIENVWSIMATAVYADPEYQSLQHWSTVSKKHGNQFLCQLFKILLVQCLTDWKQSLKTMEVPFHTNSEHGQRHRLTLTFIGPFLCNFNGGVI